MRHNIVLKTDSYKLTHYNQYPAGTKKVFSYFESRDGARWNNTVFYGLQYILKEYFEGVVVTKEKIDEAEKFTDVHIGKGVFNRKGWEHILNKHNGKLPIIIKAVEEGTPVPVSNVMMTVENTDEEVPWLTNYVETLLVQTWYSTTVATLSREIKKIIMEYLKTTGTPESINFRLHDFGYRGVSSCESAGLGGSAHLINFMGSDTIEGLTMAIDYYGADINTLAFSIPASEHSTITSWGKDHEVDAIKNVFTQNENFLTACVSDSWDVMNAANVIYGDILKDYIMNRKNGVVFRPDSGDITIVPVKVIEALMDKFGYTINAKGYKVLPDKIRVIQGDGCNINSIEILLSILKQKGISADNINFGCGGALLQMVNRDTQRFAFKCSSININGKNIDVFKQPLTDPTKNSKKGRLFLNKELKTVKEVNEEQFSRGERNEDSILKTVFENGDLKNEITFDKIRENAKL
jgi:nicotinamide phosphoribosyltransferase